MTIPKPVLERRLERAKRRKARLERRHERIKTRRHGKYKSANQFYVLERILSVLFHALNAREERRRLENDILNIGIHSTVPGENGKRHGWTGTQSAGIDERSDTMGNHKTKHGFSGDGAVDICDFAISHLILFWEHNFQRRPTMKELDEAFSSALIANYRNGSIDSSAMLKMDGPANSTVIKRGGPNEPEKT
jgi:hypothetical protein